MPRSWSTSASPRRPRDNLAFYAEEGIHAVIGTTGLSEAELAGAANSSPPRAANAIVASNFAIGAVLLMRFCELAAPHMDGVEVIELHHDAKRDAPSGTALHTAAGIAEAARARAGSGPLPADPTTEHVLPGARGGEGPGGVRVHSVRLPGLIAHEEVIFGARGAEPDHPPRLLRPPLVHARRAPGRAGRARPTRA